MDQEFSKVAVVITCCKYLRSHYGLRVVNGIYLKEAHTWMYNFIESR